MHLIDQVLMLNGNEAAVPIKVAIRVRPFVGEENYSQGESCLYCVPGKPHILVKSKNKEYQFDYVYDQNCSQKDVYSGCVTSLVDAFFTGYNGTVFAYGQTGSGKTYTMGIGSCVYLDEIQKGIVPRALDDIFRKKEALQQDVVCKLSVTFIEIYREETTDLLDNSSTLQIREDEKGTTVIVGAREETVDTLDDVFTLLDAGTALRHVGSTNMNEQSSRSHCIFTVKLEQYQFGEEQGMEGKCLCSSLHFVDLAGSERAHRTGNQGTRFKESVSINTGLLALGNVISALTDTKRKKRHVPYRESKLTRLLKNSLGGNSRTVMITCLSPTDADLDEVINSVSYASRAQKIFNQPVVNWNREKSQIDGMRKEINNLRSELQRRRSGDPRDRNYHENDEVNSRVDHLTMEHEKRDQKEATLFNILHEVNAIIHAIQSTHPPLSSQLNLQIESWRDKWKDKSQSNRPLSAPSSIIKMSHEITEQLQNELLHYKERDMENNVMIENKSNEVDELRQEVIAFGEENAKLRLDLDIAINTTRDFQERLFEQQMAIKHFQNKQPGSHPSTATVTTLPSDNYSTTGGGVRPRPNRMVERFRVKNDLLVSEIDEMDWVEHDEVMSTEEEDEDEEDGEGGLGELRDDHLEDLDQIEDDLEEEFVQKRWIQSSREKTPLVSRLPRPVRHKTAPVIRNKAMNDLRRMKSKLPVPVKEEEDVELQRLESSRQSIITGAKEASNTAQKYKRQIKVLQVQISQKESLIAEVANGESTANETKNLYHKKLVKLQKEYDKSKKELDEAQKKIAQLENTDNSEPVDPSQLKNLEADYKKKLKTMQKKLNEVQESETANKHLTKYQKNYERRLKDLEGQLARSKNLYKDVNRQLKSETDKKVKYEQELRKNEVRIKELELKTDKQQKVLKRKNEEVVKATRKLRYGVDQAKENQEFEKKRQWLENEIEKIFHQQKDIELLEKSLRDRDSSLKKKEALMVEKGELELKKTKSSIKLSKDISRISIKMDTIEEEISQHHRRSVQGHHDESDEQSVEQLIRVKDELLVQKLQMDQLFETGGLALNEERRLIELGEAIEAVEEALQYKNDLIEKKQLTLADEDVDYRNVEFLLDNMGILSKSEYKHLLGKFFIKIIELRKSAQDSDEMRCHFELQASGHEKQLEDAQHFISVMQEQREREFIELQRRHEEEVQFLMSQLQRLNESRNNSASFLEKKIKGLEKDLYFYKSKFRQGKEMHRDSHSQQQQSTDTSNMSNSGHHHGVTLPRLKHPGRLIDSEQRMTGLDSHQVEESKRLNDIFKVTNSHPRRKQKEDSDRQKAMLEYSLTDSIDVISKNPWEN